MYLRRTFIGPEMSFDSFLFSIFQFRHPIVAHKVLFILTVSLRGVGQRESTNTFLQVVATELSLSTVEKLDKLVQVWTEISA